jgi:trehalose 6-phosphate phosphatase
VSKAGVENLDSSWFFSQVSASKQRVLLVDYDGTVAPFASDRDRAYPYPHVQELLCRIMKDCNTRLVIISGRSVDAIRPLLNLDPAPETWGTHGLERLHPDGRYEGPEISDEVLTALFEAEEKLHEHGLGDLIESKPAAVAVHWRGLSTADALDARTNAYKILWPFASQSGLLLADFECGVELRLRSANKGDVVRTILSELGPDVPVAYLGDDATDEDAFHVLNGRGLSVLVRRKYRFTAAQLWLTPPDQLVAFLSAWIHASCGAA